MLSVQTQNRNSPLRVLLSKLPSVSCKNTQHLYCIEFLDKV